MQYLEHTRAMSKSYMVKVAAILLLVFFSFGCIDPDPPLPDDVIRFTVNVTEDGIIEIPKDRNSLDFGGVPPGSITEKTIGFDGNGTFVLECEGNISEWVTLFPSRFTLYDHHNVVLRISVPKDAEVGHYVSVINVFCQNT